MLLKFAIKDFLADREFRNLRPDTVTSYRYTLDGFHDYCIKNSVVDTSGVTPATIKGYLLHCKKECANNPTSMNHKLRNLRVFFGYLESIEIITSKHNPSTKVDYLKADVQIEAFTEDHIRKMLGYYQRLKRRGSEFFAFRDYAIIITLLSTGMRIGELCNMKWSDIDTLNDVIKLRGKKRDQSTIPMVDKLKRELQEYHLFVDNIFGKSCEYVFTNKYNQHLTPNAAKHIFQRLAEVMNFKDVRLSAHTFRHTFAVNMVMAGADAFTVQKLLRHSTLTMTLRYVHLYGQQLAEKNNKYNPLNTMKID